MNKRNVEKEMEKKLFFIGWQVFRFAFHGWIYNLVDSLYGSFMDRVERILSTYTKTHGKWKKNIQRKRKREKKKLFEQTTTTKLSKSHAHISRSSLVRSMKTYEDTIPFDSFKRRKKEREKDPKRVYEASRLQQWTNMRWAKSVTTPTFFLALPTKDIGNFQRYSEPNDS